MRPTIDVDDELHHSFLQDRVVRPVHRTGTVVLTDIEQQISTRYATTTRRRDSVPVCESQIGLVILQHL